MNPGNPSNNERSRDRDLYISGLLRRTVGVRQCDVDSIPEMFPQTICNYCKRVIVLIEFHRGEDYKPTTYMQAWSADMIHPVPVFCIRHNGREGKPATFFDVERRAYPPQYLAFHQEKFRLTTEEGFIEWVQELFQQHKSVCHPLL